MTRRAKTKTSIHSKQRSSKAMLIEPKATSTDLNESCATESPSGSTTAVLTQSVKVESDSVADSKTARHYVPKGKIRLDLCVVQRGLASSREKAQRLIIAGQVLVNDEPKIKPGETISSGALLRLRTHAKVYVSRGGIKLEGALDAFNIVTAGRVALDVGASTGGFTDVLLSRGIGKVFAIDVGHSQLDWKIRSNPRVIVKEKLNARYLKFDEIGQVVDVIVVDVSFISLDKILPSLLQLSDTQTDWVTLIKPQFEVGRAKVGKKGIVTSVSDQQEVLDRLKVFGEALGLVRMGLIESPIEGVHGNREFLAHWRLRPG